MDKCSLIQGNDRADQQDYKYLEFMNKEYKNTYDFLYDKKEKLKHEKHERQAA